MKQIYWSQWQTYAKCKWQTMSKGKTQLLHCTNRLGKQIIEEKLEAEAIRKH